MTRSSISTILIVLTASAAPLCAQAGAARPVHFGTMGSATIPTHYLADYYSGFDYTASATHYGFNGGAGMNFRLRRFSTFVESRYHYVIRGSRIGAPSCEVLSALIAQTCPSDTRPSLQFVPISAGFAF